MITKRRLRVGFLIDRWQPTRGGAEQALAALAEHLSGRGHEVLAFGVRGDPNAPGEFHAVPSSGWTRAGRELRLAAALVAAAKAAGCDLTVGVRHLASVDLLWLHGGSHLESLRARRRARGRRMEAEPAGRHRVFLRLEREALEGGARRVVCVSDHVREELEHLYPGCAERLSVVPNGVDLERFAAKDRSLRGELEVGDDEPLLVFTAHDPVLKGLPVLLDALRLVPARPWRLVVAGVRRTAAFERIARSTPGRVHFRDHVDAARLFGAADLAVQPTWRDPCSLATLEALASGTPVVTTSTNGARNAIVEPACGTILSDPGDATALARAIADWLDRIEGGAVDTNRVRAAVADRGRGPWMERMEAELLGMLRP